ncbi:hypothetical protein SAMN05216353_1632 [Halobacillus alkaliphilus]|uniref:Uncharacterized protein n=1 Tax=Halobacillus alkaliphilus TaxID=396056 RepID=A0A1I2T806_9BACI|nr:hypothetical protein SAMN05216353_1632 [Halobacillus alkaliphilus]
MITLSRLNISTLYRTFSKPAPFKGNHSNVEEERNSTYFYSAFYQYLYGKKCKKGQLLRAALNIYLMNRTV